MIMELILAFDDKKGVECKMCILSTIKGEKEVCAGLGSRPICSEEGCRMDCPLIQIN